MTADPRSEGRPATNHVRLLSSDGNLLGIAEAKERSGILHPCIVLV
jgi:hypothetical protein